MKQIHLTFLFFFSLFIAVASAQNTIGIPTIVNYGKQDYSAGSQNWNIAQDERGLMYFANNDGLLSFDGSSWRLYKLPNKTITRSVAVAADGKIYVGGQGEIGYFSPDKKSELVYTSLNKLLSKKDNDFADIWNICFFNKKVFFRANKKILEFDGSKVKVYDSFNWGYLGVVNGQLLANKDDKGIVFYDNGDWQQKINVGKLPDDNFALRTVLPIGKDSALLVSLMHGLYIIHKDTLFSFKADGISEAAAKNISSACVLSTDRIALATNLAGCIIINNQGKFIQRFTKKEGIQNNNVLSVFLDNHKNLWLGLDNGIDLVTFNNAIKNIFPDQEDRNSGYTSVVYNNNLYLGVSTGAYYIPLNSPTNDLSYANGLFTFIENSKGQVWSLSAINGKLLMGHNKGAYYIEGKKAIELDTKTGYWGFQLFDNSNTIVAGTYAGINFFSDHNTNLSAPVVYSQVESARYVAVSDNLVWIAHPYKGIYSVKMEGCHPIAASKYKDSRRILSTNHNKIFKIKGKVILSTDNGLFEFDEKQNEFIPSEWLKKLIGHTTVSYLKEDRNGNIWFCRDKRVGVVDMTSGNPQITRITEIDGKIMGSGFENINVIDSNNVLIAADRGFFHINYASYKKNKQSLQVLIRKVQTTLKDDGLIYGGYNKLAEEPLISYNYNSLHFEAASTLFGQEQNLEFSFFLKGFDKSWSPWSRKIERDYTNLPAGSYTLQVKCRNNIDNESPVAIFSFHIQPPWYQTWWAYLLYLLIFIGLLYFFYKRQQLKYRRQQLVKLQEQQRKYDEEQKQLQLQHQLVIQQNEKKIIELKNDKLQAEVEHKNAELATSAMNLVQKKELLSKLKDELTAYKNNPEADRANKEFQKILKLIDKELDHNEEWEQFAIHFDSVHTNYLKKLKDQFPSLTTSDLKLAAYLRLNLSSKEMAQLMNISLRGVETSRYRLRKKLGIENDTNLFDHLINITS